MEFRLKLGIHPPMLACVPGRDNAIQTEKRDGPGAFDSTGFPFAWRWLSCILGSTMKPAALIFPLLLSLVSAGPEAPAPAAADPGTAPATADHAPTWESGIATAAVIDNGPAVAVPVEKADPDSSAASQGALPRLFSPYPVKLLSRVPDGWRLAADPEVPARRHKVTLSNGKVLEIGVTPPVLQPCREGATVIRLPDGGIPAPTALLAEVRRHQAESRDRLQSILEVLQQQLPPVPAAPATPPPAP
jgi:hypothetical protein